MKQRALYFVLFFSLLISQKSYAQYLDKEFYLVDSLKQDELSEDDKILLDSLLTIYKKTSSDSVRLELLTELANTLSEAPVWIKYNRLALAHVNKLLVRSPEGAIFKQYLVVKLKALNNMGLYNKQRGKIKEALDYYYQAAKIAEDLNITGEMAVIYSNIGMVHKMHSEYEKALLYYEKALKLAKEERNYKTLTSVLTNMGVVYLKQSDTVSARNCFNECYSIQVKEGNKNGMMYSLANLAQLDEKQGNVKLAMQRYNESLKLSEELNDLQNMATVLFNMAMLYKKLGDDTMVEKLALRSLAIAQKLGYPGDIKDPAFVLYELYDRQKRYKESLQMYKINVTMRDSIYNQKLKRDVYKQQVQYEYDKKALADSLKVVEERKITEVKLQQEKTQRYALWIGVLFLLGFLGFVYNRFKISQKQNKIINEQKQEVELQKNIVEEKNRDITDSINYSKSLQQAILPPEKLIREFLPQLFVLYKPKHIVAGDFFWFEPVNLNEVLLAAADCTGHGVPGAIVSVVCSNALNRVVKEFNITEPGKVLDKTRELVIDTFKKSERQVKDGMDISLIKLNVHTNEIQWAGAHNPLWYIQNGELKEIKADKQPIGYSEKETLFTTHTISLNKGDSVFLITDGYADQFGGEKGKKFKYKALQELILSISGIPMKEQKEKLDTVFEQWRGLLEQTDDVTIIGIKV